jgi:hypothetical protein
MNITPQYVVKADLVLLGSNLLSAPDALPQFTAKVDDDFQQQQGMDISLSAGPTGGATAGPSRTLIFPQDRITLNLTAARSSISKDYPSVERLDTDLGKLAEIATLAIDVSRPAVGNTLRAYGYNMQVVFRLRGNERAIQYLGERLFSRNIAVASGKTLVGGTASLILRDGATQWTFAANPWPNGDPNADRVALSVNRHTENPVDFPSHETIVRDLLHIWAEVHAFMSSLDTQSGETDD